jgi:carbon storage regulator
MDAIHNTLILNQRNDLYKTNRTCRAPSHMVLIYQGGTSMLVLSRKMNESVIIDGGIEVMVVAVHGNKVRLGFRAPADVAIHRAERAMESDETRHHPRHVDEPAPTVVGHSQSE